jgi:hypothetical protein
MKAYLLADRPGGREAALELYEQVRNDANSDTWWVRQISSKILLLLGDIERTREDCRKWMKLATESDSPSYWEHLDKLSIAYLAGELSKTEYLQADATVHGKFYAYYTLAFESIGNRNWDDAREYLEKCVVNANHAPVETNWAKAFLNRLRDDVEDESGKWPRAHVGRR